MYQNNNQNIFRQKLEERNIQPSKNAWHNLEAKLKMQPAKKYSGKKLYGAAASVIVLTAISALLLFYRGNVQEAALIAAETMNTKHLEQDIPDVNLSSEKKIKYEPVKEKPFSKTKTVKNIAVQSPVEIKKINKVVPVEERKELQIFSIENKNRMAITPADLTDAEIEMLLDNAEKELTEKKRKNIVTQAKATVLLDEVESDLQKNKSFKSKVYDEIEQKLQKIKTVFSNK